ncbi:hypothetical protein G6F56_013024 [Rhizopus delemar]|nr:hypothetical protein G6F56_013024 [Rhizopus delemar]
MCPAFTEYQKTTLLQISHLTCPRQLASFLSVEPVYSAYHMPKEDDPSISSLLFEIQQNCHLEPKKSLNNKHSINNKNGIPLLLHPLESKLSPWAPAYSPNPWKEPSLEPNNNKNTNSKILTT